MFTASSRGRVWHAYAPYDPERVVWLLELYWTAYNYIFVGKDEKTPAMRLGLAKGPLEYEISSISCRPIGSTSPTSNNYVLAGYDKRTPGYESQGATGTC